jgi:hypothetical protein
VLLWLDDLDDLFGTVGLLAERMRRLFVALARLAAFLAITTCGVFAALAKPPLGLAVVILLFVFLLYRSVTQPGFLIRSRRAAA